MDIVVRCEGWGRPRHATHRHRIVNIYTNPLTHLPREELLPLGAGLVALPEDEARGHQVVDRFVHPGVGLGRDFMCLGVGVVSVK